ncbi:nuclear transport factor 2 family protein [Saccharopolyspora sp. K220]|uniref:nuclear transport factor 2 family protein n=1 Tax=Saccharopolyspora soli TaxID=2926618 RepID=UPI001F57187F|nr:nuclear transport factor 2 family protein [Saccharopolyspora soli]MCI2422941.1 nuclear transport factor 2 family protein [Saccharopolyspora soli]
MTTHSDIDQIRELKARYCRFADAKQWDEVADLFTEDAMMRFYDVDGGLLNQVTAAQFAAEIGERVGAGQPIHHLFSHEIEFTTATTAKGVWAMEDLIFHDRKAHPDAPFDSMHGLGHYHDTYRKTPDGWRISGSELTRLRLQFVR